MSPRISIIIPVHNREGLLPETLKSVCAQTFTDWECIIVDDHSTDSALAIAKSYERKDHRFRAFPLPDAKRYGNSARNYGLSLAQGEFVSFLDSDDLIIATKLQRQLEAFETDPTLDCVTSRYALFKQDPLKDANPVNFAPSSNWLNAVWTPNNQIGCLWQTGCPLWRVASVRRIGAWNEGVRLWQDGELNVRALVSGLRIVRLEQIMVFVRAGDGGSHLSYGLAKRSPEWRHGLLTAWRSLEDAQLVTELRRRMIAMRFYRMARALLDDGQVALAVKIWLRDSRSIGQKPLRTLYGVAVLITGNYRWFGPVFRRIRPGFFRYLDEMTPAQPTAGEVPLSKSPRKQDQASERLRIEQHVPPIQVPEESRFPSYVSGNQKVLMRQPSFWHQKRHADKGMSRLPGLLGMFAAATSFILTVGISLFNHLKRVLMDIV